MKKLRIEVEFEGDQDDVSTGDVAWTLIRFAERFQRASKVDRLHPENLIDDLDHAFEAHLIEEGEKREVPIPEFVALQTRNSEMLFLAHELVMEVIDRLERTDSFRQYPMKACAASLSKAREGLGNALLAFRSALHGAIQPKDEPFNVVVPS